MEATVVLTVKDFVVSVLLGGVVWLFLYICNDLVWKPRRLGLKLGKQGIRGPPPCLLFGNVSEMKRIQLQNQSIVATKDLQHHLWFSNIFPYFEQWRKKYGPIYMHYPGHMPVLMITDMEMVKEIALCTSLNLGKPSHLSKDKKALLGQGILTSNALIWLHQRKIIAPEFYLHKVKGMVRLMVDSTTFMLSSWENLIEGRGVVDIRVDDDLRSLSADIISRACFGSNYSKGQQIFSKIRSLQEILSKGGLNITFPGLSYMPTKSNRTVWRIEKEIDSMILKVVKERIETTEENDLLQIILDAAKSYGDEHKFSKNMDSDRFIVDNCKNIYFAGHETTAITVSWALMLLATCPDWQARARAEVLESCRDGVPDADTLHRMKTVTMVVQETLRLYPPGAFVTREALQDMKIGDLVIPGGLSFLVPIPVLHQEPELWGPDAHQFNPERFSHGIAGACKDRHAYLPFGAGLRTCVGQHFAMVEVKVILCLILSKFSFSLSPGYQHHPAFKLVIGPGKGINLLMRRL